MSDDLEALDGSDPVARLRHDVDQMRAAMFDMMPAVFGVMDAAVASGFTREEGFTLAREWWARVTPTPEGS